MVNRRSSRSLVLQLLRMEVALAVLVAVPLLSAVVRWRFRLSASCCHR